MRKNISKFVTHAFVALFGVTLLTLTPNITDKTDVLGIGAKTVYAGTTIDYGNGDYRKEYNGTGVNSSVNYAYESGAQELVITGSGAVTQSDVESYLTSNEYNNIDEVAVMGDITAIGDYSFAGLTKLSWVNLSSTDLTSIGDYAFSNCPIITDDFYVSNWNSIYNLGEGAFENTKLSSIVIPSSVTEIADNLFNGCSNLSSVTMHDNITRIGDNAFEYCDALKNISIPNSVREISYYAFGHSGLTSIELPAGITYQESSFEYCVNLKSVVILSGSSSVLFDNIFDGCTNLTTFKTYSTISPNGNIFDGCTNLKDVYCFNTPAKYWGSELEYTGDNDLANATFHVPAGEVDNYIAYFAYYNKNVKAVVALGIADTLTTFGTGYYCVDTANGNTYIIATCTSEQADANSEIQIKSGADIVHEGIIDTVYETIQFDDYSSLNASDLGSDYITAVKFAGTGGIVPTGTMTIEYIPISA